MLLSILRLDFANARVSDVMDDLPIEVLRSAQSHNLAVQPQEVGRALNGWLADDLPASPWVIPHPTGAGEVSIALRRGLGWGRKSA